MAQLTMPTPEQALGKCTCPNCGREVTLKIDSYWFRFFSQLLTLINEGL